MVEPLLKSLDTGTMVRLDLIYGAFRNRSAVQCFCTLEALDQRVNLVSASTLQKRVFESKISDLLPVLEVFG